MKSVTRHVTLLDGYILLHRDYIAIILLTYRYFGNPTYKNLGPTSQ